MNPSLSGGEEKEHESIGIHSSAQLDTINQIKKNKRFKQRKQKGSRNKFTLDVNAALGRTSPYNYHSHVAAMNEAQTQMINVKKNLRKVSVASAKRRKSKTANPESTEPNSSRVKPLKRKKKPAKKPEAEKGEEEKPIETQEPSSLRDRTELLIEETTNMKGDEEPTSIE